MHGAKAFILATVVVWTGSAACVALGQYRFEKVAEAPSASTPTALKLLGVPAVNDAGVVAFTQSAGDGEPSRPWGTVSLYYGTPGDLKGVTEPGGVWIQRPRPVDINNAGQIGFVGSESIHRFNPDGTVTTFVPRSQRYTVVDGPAIDDAGRLAWVGANSALNVVGLETSEGPTHIEGAGPFYVVSGAHRNNEGMSLVTHPIGLFYGSPTFSRFIVNGGGGPMTYTDPETGVTGPLNHYGAADAGDGDRAVFTGNHAGVYSLYVWHDGGFSKVPGTGGAAFLAVPAINDVGQVAALLGDGERLSFFDAAGEHRVISLGDAFDGSAVTGLAFTAEGWNDAGQLAFNATLADGRGVNILATLPEPGAAGVPLLVAGVSTLRRRRA